MLPLPTELLEERILPARVPDYRPADLDDLTRRDELVWFAAGRERIVLALPEDRDVAPVTAAAPTNARAPDTSPADDVPAQVPRADELFPARRGRFSFWDIHDAAKGSVEETEAALYDLLYAGVVSADTLQPLRRRRSSGAASTRTSRHSRRASTRGSGRRARPSAPPASSAYWYRLASTSTPASDVEATEAAKDRARIVLDRYGIVFRERLRDEAVGFRWGDLVNALRLLELAGEVYGGYFVHGVSGLQFAGAEALELLSELSETGSHRQEGHAASTARPIFQLSAADPASLAGMGLTGLSYELPARQSSTIIVYRGSRPAVIARRNGKDLRIAPEVAAEDPDLPHLFSFAEQEVSRAVRPASRFVVEEINGEAASHSPYAASLQRLGFHRDHTRLVLWARRR
jgi:ATP-dependent Lhr-like helicase